MSFQKFHNFGAINRTTIISFANDTALGPLLTSGQTVFDRTQENNMGYIEGYRAGKGMWMSSDMFFTRAKFGTSPFQFSWVSPRTGSNDVRVLDGQESMDAGDGTAYSASGDSCVGFTYNYPLSSNDVLCVQFVGVCEMRATGTYNQGLAITGNVVTADSGKGLLTASSATSNAFGIQLNDYNYSTGGYILAKVNASEKF